MTTVTTYSYDSLRDNILQVYRRAGGTRPDVMHVKVNDQHLVIKDYNPTSGLFGVLAGPVLVKREFRALTMLQGIKGIPELFHCDNKRVLVTSFCASQSAVKLTRPLDWPKFENRLHSLISNMHAAGVAHCDLRGPGNILIDDADRPWLVDYVACFFKAPGWNKPWNGLFSQACKADFSAILKLKQKIAPHQLTAEETKLLDNNASKGWLFRKTSRGLRRFARWIFAAGKN